MPKGRYARNRKRKPEETVLHWREAVDDGNLTDRQRKLVDAYMSMDRPAIDEEFRDFLVTTKPLPYLRICIELGIYPPPELLLAISARFGAYLEGEGQYTLEEVLLQPLDRSGEYAKHAAKDKPWNRAAFVMGRILNSNEGLTKIEAAKSALKLLNLDLNPYTLVRYVSGIKED